MKGNIMKDKLLKKAKNSIFPIVFFGFMMGFFGPVQLYLNNASEFYFYFKDIIWICILMTLGFMLVPLALVLVTPKKISEWIGTVLFGITLALYIQGNYVKVDYGTLNGDALIWSNYKAVAIWNTALWIVLIAIPIVLKIVKPEISKLVTKYGSVWIVAIQAVTLIILALTLKPKTQNNGECIFTSEGKFTLSNNNNTIVFVLDCYETADFQKLLKDHSEYKEELFTNFTYYPNTVGGSTRTVLAIPNLLTGMPYTSEGKYSDYLNDAFGSCQTYEILENKNYDSRIYTETTFAPSDSGIDIKNLKKGKKEVHNYPLLGLKLYQFTACQYFPHLAKQYVWMYSGDFDKAALNKKSDKSAYQLDDDIFYEQLCDKKISTIDEDAFRVYHLNGNHGPFKLKADATSDGKETSTEEQQMGVMTILGEYFDQMKKLGIYDDANIIICADHGASGIECNPIFLIKEGKNTTKFTESNIPVSYENLQPTIIKFLGEKPKSGIKAVDELTMEDNKERYFYYQNKKANESIEYKITGVLPNNAKEEETGRRFKLFAVEASEYELGEEIFFNVEGTALAYIKKGLGKTEAGQTWTDGYEFEMELPVDYTDNDDLYLHFKFNKLELPKEHVGVSVNGEFINWYLVEDKSLNVRVPGKLVKDKGKINIHFDMPDASWDGDERYCVFCMKSLTIDKIKGNFAETKIIKGPTDN